MEITIRTRRSATKRRGEDGDHLGVGPADERGDQDDEGDDQRQVGGGGQALAPEVCGAVVGGAEIADTSERRDHARHQRTASPTAQRSTVSTAEPIRVPQAIAFRASLPRPTPKSQTRWRMPPSMWRRIAQL